MKRFKILPVRQVGHFLFLFLALGILFYSCRGELLRIPSGKMIDFKHFYFAAQALIMHHDLYSSGTGGYIYPPFFAFLIIPLAFFSYSIATSIWLLINLVLICTILWLGFLTLAKCFNLTFTVLQAIGACSLAILLSYDPLRWELLLGQSDVLMLAGFALALYWIVRYPFLAGVILGATVNIKYLALGFLPFFLLRARFKTICGLLAGSLGFALLPAIVSGWQTNLNNLAIALKGLAFMADPAIHKLAGATSARVPSIDWHLNITISSGLFRMLTAHGFSKIEVFLSIATLMLVIFGIFTLIFLRQGIPFIWRTPQTLNDPQKELQILTLEWHLLFVVILIFSPQNTSRHLFLLLSTHLFAAILLLFPKDGVKVAPLLISIFIMQAGMGLRIEHIWQYGGGPCWSIVPFLLILSNTVLNYITGAKHKLTEWLTSAGKLFNTSVFRAHEH